MSETKDMDMSSVPAAAGSAMETELFDSGSSRDHGNEVSDDVSLYESNSCAAAVLFHGSSKPNKTFRWGVGSMMLCSAVGEVARPSRDGVIASCCAVSWVFGRGWFDERKAALSAGTLRLSISPRPTWPS
jgi:hypothetical protein